MHSSDSISEISDRMDQTLISIERLFIEANFGPLNVGYRWRNLFLPNGTMLRVRHARRRYTATVTHGDLIFQGEPSTPAKMLRDITEEDKADLWGKIYVSLPGDMDWRVAADVRKEIGTKDVRRFDRPRYTSPTNDE
jgi:hypothetical protein